MKKRFFAALLCLCLLVGLVPGMGTTVFAASTTDYAIGDTVDFGGYSWRIIGTETEGVTAPAGCYTLLIASTIFGSTAFREGADGKNQSDNYYKDSDLQQKMEEIADDFSFVERQNIVPRNLTAANDEIAGPDVNDQYVWALSQTEAENVYNNSIWYSWYYIYWTRTDVEEPPGSHYVYINRTYTGGDTIIPTGHLPSESRYIFPALYVKASALPAPPATGDFVLGQNTISSAAVGGGLVQNSGSDVGLTINAEQKADVRVYSDRRNQSGSTLSFNLHRQDTTAGENQVLACVLTDQNGTVKYYGKLADCSSASSEEVSVSLPVMWVEPGIYTLSIFSHNTATNAISAPSPTMTVTVIGGVGTVSDYDGEVDYVIVFPEPTFTKQPQSQYVMPNESVTFSVQAEQNGGFIDDGSSYSWYAQDKSNPNGTWYQISGWQSGSLVALPIEGKTFTISNVSGTWSENDLILQAAGADVSFQPKDARFRCVVTGVLSGSATSNAAELWVIEGSSQDGREVELKNDGTNILWRYKGEDDDAWQTLVALSDITGSDGTDGKQVELRIEGGWVQWKYDTDTDWQNLLALSALQGAKGDKGDQGETGAKGDSGDTPYIGSNGTWWIGGVDTGVQAAAGTGTSGRNGTDGQDGVGIASLEINESGELVITLTDGTVKNLGKVTGEDGAGISGVTINE